MATILLDPVIVNDWFHRSRLNTQALSFIERHLITRAYFSIANAVLKTAMQLWFPGAWG